jgi:branched-chain amino acid aminotransferase
MTAAPMISLNGELISANEACVSPFDLGLTVGLGVFETMAAYDGKVFAYDLHHARLIKSAEVFALPVPERSVITAAITEVIEANHYHQGRYRIRVTLTGGVNQLGGGREQGDVMVTAQAADSASGGGSGSGSDLAKLAWVPFVINESAATVGVKSTSYADHVLAYRHALNAGADEALMLNSQGHLAEGSMSNVFVVKDGVVQTPSLASGCLPGVTRQLVIVLCADLDLPIKECQLGEQDIDRADEIFLTSSLREIQAAVLLGTEARATEAVTGEVTVRLAEAYAEMVRKELS